MFQELNLLPSSGEGLLLDRQFFNFILLVLSCRDSNLRTFSLLHLKKILSCDCQRFQNDRDECHTVVTIPGGRFYNRNSCLVSVFRMTEMSVTQWLQSRAVYLYDTGYKSWSHGMTNVSIPEVNMFKIAQHLL